MRSQFSRTAAIFFNPETLVPFLLGSVFLAVLGNAVWQIALDFFMQLTGGNTTLAALQIAVGSLLIFSFSVLLFARGLRRMEPQILPGAHTPSKHRGLILLVSREATCRVAIEYHQPELKYCWLLHSNESRQIAIDLREEFEAQGITFNLILVENVYNPVEFFHTVRRIYASLPPNCDPQDVIADYTGMTAHGSVGMVLAGISAPPYTPLQYTPAQPEDPTKSMAPIEIVLRPKRSIEAKDATS